MDLPEYITREEVKRVCAELGLQDWTALETAKIPAAEAEIGGRTQTTLTLPPSCPVNGAHLSGRPPRKQAPF